MSPKTSKTKTKNGNPARSTKSQRSVRGNGATLDFESQLWAAADKLRGHMDASEYKHVVLGLVFLKYISDSFEEVHAQLVKEKDANPEDRDEYLAQNIFWVPKEARAKLRVMVRRILRHYGYPPDKQEKATQTVLEQAEVIAKDWAG